MIITFIIIRLHLKWFLTVGIQRMIGPTCTVCSETQTCNLVPEVVVVVYCWSCQFGGVLAREKHTFSGRVRQVDLINSLFVIAGNQFHQLGSYWGGFWCQEKNH